MGNEILLAPRRGGSLILAVMRNAGSYYLIALGLMLCVAGGAFAWLMWRSFDRASAQRDWDEVPCRILESRLAERRIGPEAPAEYSWKVLFNYEFGGERRDSGLHSVRGSSWSHSPAKAEALLGQCPAGDTAVGCVGPGQRCMAVLKRDARRAGWSRW